MEQTIRAQKRRCQGGLSYIETLVASIILAVSIMGIVSAWSFSVGLTGQVGDDTVAYNLGRQTLENIKGTGFTGTAEGSSTLYYDINGKNPSSTQGANRFAVTTVVTSDRFDGTETGPVVSASALRAVVVTVTDLETNQVIYTTGTNLAFEGV